MSAKLRFASVTVISKEVCAQGLPGTPFLSTFMCAVSSTTSPIDSGTPCFGDTGNALVINEVGAWTQIGLATVYPRGCKTGVPTIYTSISSSLDWIASITGVAVRP